jgi:hypothetical protein
MHALFVSYRLRGATAAEHAELCAQLAPAFAAVAGLVSLTWLANQATARYGGFYVFRDKPAFDAFVASELFEALRSHRAVDELTGSEFEIDQRPTALTRGPARSLTERSRR